MHQTFSVHTTLEEFKNAQLVFEKYSAGKSHNYRDAIVFKTTPFQTIFRPHENEKPAFEIPPVWRAFS